MAYISRTGNLAGVPTLRDGDRGVYTYARVIVADRIPREGGGYEDGPSIAYDVAVSGSQAEQLVATAEASGNIRITFSGRYTVTAYQDPQNSGRTADHQPQGPGRRDRREPARPARDRPSRRSVDCD